VVSAASCSVEDEGPELVESPPESLAHSSHYRPTAALKASPPCNFFQVYFILLKLLQLFHVDIYICDKLNILLSSLH
jgi:hypothetical protein